jgi:(p)ppGpp synthase/HD superfamily hydrolase
MANFTNTPRLGQAFVLAFNFAFQSHKTQVRKQGEVPYISHLMSVAALVLEAGGSEDEAIAALLHNAVEDAGVELSSVLFHFGPTVAAIVAALTENQRLLSRAERQAAYIHQVATADDDAILVSAADTLHNLRCYAADGRELWGVEQERFYERLLPIYADCDRVPTHWVEEMWGLLESLAISR